MTGGSWHTGVECVNCRFSTILCVLFVLGSLRGQEAAVDIDQAVRDLGAPAFEVRKRARTTLAELGWEAKAELEQAAKHPDPEVSGTARQLLRDMLPGVTRDTPDRQRRLMKRYVAAESPRVALQCVAGLLEERPMPHGLLLALLDWQKDRQQWEATMKKLLEELPGASYPYLLVDGPPENCDYFVDWMTREEREEQIPRIAAHAYHRGKLDAMREKIAALVAVKPSPYSRELLVELHLLAGHEDEALAAAREWGEWPFLEGLLVRTCRWGELAKELAARPEEPSGLGLLKLAAVQRLAGQGKLAVATLRRVMAYDEKGKAVRLVEAAGGTPAARPDVELPQWQEMDRDYVVPKRAARARKLFVFGPKGQDPQEKAHAWRCLLLFGLTGDAVQVLLNQGERDTAESLLWYGDQHGQVDRLRQMAIAEAKPAKKWVLAARRAGEQLALGDDTAVEAAREILERCRKGEKELADPEVCDSVVWALHSAGFHELVADMLPGMLVRAEAKDGEISLRMAARLCPDKQLMMYSWPQIGAFWWERLVKADPEQGLMARVTRLQDFLRGRLSPEETQEVLRLGLRPEAPTKERVQDLVMLARTSAVLGRQTEAEAAYALAMRDATAEGDLNLLRHVCYAGEAVFMPVGKWSELAAVHARLAEQGEPSSLFEQAFCLARAGDRAAGQKLVDRAVAMSRPGVFSWSLRSLLQWGDRQTIDRVLPLVRVAGAESGSSAFWFAREVKDHALELRLAQRLWYRNMCSLAGSDSAADIEDNAVLAFAVCRAMIADGGLAAGLALAKGANDVFPNESDQVKYTVEALDHAGAKDEADELASHALSHYRKILDRWPRAAECLNNFAWLCALTGRELAEGEACVRKAIERVPGDGDYHDTLAVLLHRKGDMAGALKAARTCVRLQPADFSHRRRVRDWLQEQKQKQ